MKYRFLLCAGLFALAARLPAATVSFLVVETGLPNGSPSPESSSLWENGLMDVFFDAGHIVSNAPVLRLYMESVQNVPDKKVPRAFQDDFRQARNGGADFFIVAVLKYMEGELKKPVSVMLCIYSITGEALLYESSVKLDGALSSREELAAAKDNAWKLVPLLNGKG